jgi:hypothetical protein
MLSIDKFSFHNSAVQQPLSPVFTLEEALQHMGNGRYQLILFFVCGAVILSCSLCIGFCMSSLCALNCTQHYVHRQTILNK